MESASRLTHAGLVYTPLRVYRLVNVANGKAEHCPTANRAPKQECGQSGPTLPLPPLAAAAHLRSLPERLYLTGPDDADGARSSYTQPFGVHVTMISVDS